MIGHILGKYEVCNFSSMIRLKLNSYSLSMSREIRIAEIGIFTFLKSKKNDNSAKIIRNVAFILGMKYFILILMLSILFHLQFNPLDGFLDMLIP